MKIYDLVYQCLKEHEQARNSDKFLYFFLLSKLGLVKNRTLTWENFKKAPSFETVRRSRQDIQSKHPELAPTSDRIREIRGHKENTKGTFIYREEVEINE
ncbi:MAG TPA: hypothetical protein DHM42_08030, partial [Clostridiales bacterium]|nr:hypothetical protein [Clostridiales bacterium]